MNDQPPEILSKGSRISGPIAAGIFLIAMMVLVLQIAITRIMSVTVSHYSAFMVLAIVMLGLASSGIAAFRDINRKEQPATPRAAVKAAFLAALCAAVALVVYVQVVSVSWGSWYQPYHIFFAAAIFYPAFHFAGYVIAALLTHFARDISRLYWFDLVGAAGGCLVIVPLLNLVSALDVVLISACGMAIAGTLLSCSIGWQKDLARGLGLSLALVGVLGICLWFPELTRLRYRAGLEQKTLLWERWNSLAKVSIWPETPTVTESVEAYRKTHRIEDRTVKELQELVRAGWGISKAYPGKVALTLLMELDSSAGTQIVGKGLAPKEDLEFLKWDVTAAAYWLLPTQALERIFIVGGGGGRDVLTALIFDARDVDVVELNPAVIEAVQGPFANFSGRIYSSNNVHLQVGEARSNLSRRQDRYDLIQMSMIDTWASSMAGSLVLAENTLYTQEAFTLFLSRLKDDGMLSVSRWYHQRQYGELARVLGLMVHALQAQGVTRPEDHIAVVYNQGYLDILGVGPVVNCIVKKTPFTAAQRTALVDLCKRMKYTLLWPDVEGVTKHEFLDILGVIKREPRLLDDPEFDLTVPTDDRPFFFNTRRPIRSWIGAIQSGDLSRGSQSAATLGGMLLVMTLASLVVVVRPLRLYHSTLPEKERQPLASYRRPIFYFAGIGLGFMLVELALIQRYILFLGHPTYAMSVVLFALLLFSGVGSSLTSRCSADSVQNFVRLPLLGVLAALLATAFAVPVLLDAAYPWPLPLRLILAAALIAPLGLCMGMIYPLGVRILVRSRLGAIVPWMWGINGICAVLASVLGMCVAISFGYTVVILLGMLAYAVTLVATLGPGRSSSIGSRRW